jgi:hypothetical protein
MILVDVLITIGAVIDVSTERFGPTMFNGPHRLPMTGQQPVTNPIGRAIWRKMLFHHGRSI